MEPQEIKIKAEAFLEAKQYESCASWSLAAIFSASGLSWPYFFNAESLYSLDEIMLSRSFYKLYTLRAREGDPASWIETAKKRLE